MLTELIIFGKTKLAKILFFHMCKFTRVNNEQILNIITQYNYSSNRVHLHNGYQNPVNHDFSYSTHVAERSKIHGEHLE